MPSLAIQCQFPEGCADKGKGVNKIGNLVDTINGCPLTTGPPINMETFLTNGIAAECRKKSAKGKRWRMGTANFLCDKFPTTPGGLLKWAYNYDLDDARCNLLKPLRLFEICNLSRVRWPWTKQGGLVGSLITTSDNRLRQRTFAINQEGDSVSEPGNGQQLEFQGRLPLTEG